MRDHLMVAVLGAHNLQKFVEDQKKNHNKLEVIVKGWDIKLQYELKEILET